MSEESKIVIGVPGKWAGRSAIVQSIATDSGGYLFVGSLMSNVESKEVCTLEIYDHDPELRQAFTLAGCGKISEADLESIGEHTHTLYISGPSSTPEEARKLMRFAAAILSCGGVAVKVESTGLAHSTDQWRSLTDDDSLAALMHAFVTYVGNNGSYYSCGMHNLGLPDVTLQAEVTPETAAALLDAFSYYLASESPELKDGDTFAIDAKSPTYAITKSECTEFPKDDLFHNPNGVWQLAPAKPKPRSR